MKKRNSNKTATKKRGTAVSSSTRKPLPRVAGKAAAGRSKRKVATKAKRKNPAAGLPMDRFVDAKVRMRRVNGRKVIDILR